MCLLNQFLKICHRAVLRLNVVEVTDVVSEVHHGGHEYRGHPDRTNSGLHKVFQLARDTCNKVPDCFAQ